jgi:hypothetical protein
LDCPGEQLVSQVEVEIGGQRIDRQYGDWMHIWNQMTLSSEQAAGYNKMIGQTTALTYVTDPNFDAVNGPCASTAGPAQVCAPRNALPETTLYVPLMFWFCRNPGLALPLIALQYHEVKVNIDFRPIGECLWAVNDMSSATKATSAYSSSLVAASLYVDYIFLDTDERRKMAQNPHEYLIEQVQFTGDESVGSSSNKIKLNFNHPCKELVWVAQPDAHVNYCDSLVKDKPLFKLMGAQPFNYSDALDVLPNSIMAFGSEAGVSGAGNFVTGDADSGVAQFELATHAAGSEISTAGVTDAPHSSLPKQLLTCTAGVKTLSSPLSSNLTAKIASLNVKVLTSTLFNLTNTTAVPLMPVLTFTPSLFAPKNTNLLAHATSPVLTMPSFN